MNILKKEKFMKKFALALVAVISTLLMCLSFAACSSDVVGNTYVFDDAKFEFTSDVSAEDRAEMESGLGEMKEMYSEVEFTFKEDGTCTGIESTVVYYVQEGDTVYLYESKEKADANDKTDCSTLKVDGKKLIMEESDDGITLKVIFKKK